jgi:hypothetical protein
MKILSWLKNKIKNFFLRRKKILNDKETVLSSSIINKEVNTFTSGPSYNVETKVVDLFKEISDLKEQVSEKLKVFEKSIKEIEELKKDASNILRKSEKTENMVYIGFLVFLTMIAGLVFSYIEFVSTKNVNNDSDFKYNFLEKINNNENSIKMLKICLNSNKWLNPKCFEN